MAVVHSYSFCQQCTDYWLLRLRQQLYNIIATQLWRRGCNYRRFEWDASNEWNKSVARDGQRSHENLSSVILKWTYILESLEAAPPVTLATSNCDNSVLSSSSCFRSSSFFFPRSSWAFTFTWSTTKHHPGKQLLFYHLHLNQPRQSNDLDVAKKSVLNTSRPYFFFRFSLFCTLKNEQF